MVLQKKTVPSRGDSQYKVPGQKLSTPGLLTETGGQCGWSRVWKGGRWQRLRSEVTGESDHVLTGHCKVIGFYSSEMGISWKILSSDMIWLIFLKYRSGCGRRDRSRSREDQLGDDSSNADETLMIGNRVVAAEMVRGVRCWIKFEGRTIFWQIGCECWRRQMSRRTLIRVNLTILAWNAEHLQIRKHVAGILCPWGESNCGWQGRVAERNGPEGSAEPEAWSTSALQLQEPTSPLLLCYLPPK